MQIRGRAYAIGFAVVIAAGLVRAFWPVPSPPAAGRMGWVPEVRSGTAPEGLRPGQWLRLARLLRRRGDREGALRVLKRAVVEHPGDRRLAWALIRLKRSLDASTRLRTRTKTPVGSPRSSEPQDHGQGAGSWRPSASR